MGQPCGHGQAGATQSSQAHPWQRKSGVHYRTLTGPRKAQRVKIVAEAP
tara:strand:- start:2209 stop:2355 length:147 start_codon:yes stop_codon:yes gene_type:complete